MPRRNAEQIRAEELLTEAIQINMQAYGNLEPDEMTQEYVVVVATQRLGRNDNEPEVSNAITSIFRDGSVSTSRAVGLLVTCKQLILEQEQQ